MKRFGLLERECKERAHDFVRQYTVAAVNRQKIYYNMMFCEKYKSGWGGIFVYFPKKRIQKYNVGCTTKFTLKYDHIAYQI